MNKNPFVFINLHFYVGRKKHLFLFIAFKQNSFQFYCFTWISVTTYKVQDTYILLINFEQKILLFLITCVILKSGKTIYFHYIHAKRVSISLLYWIQRTLQSQIHIHLLEYNNFTQRSEKRSETIISQYFEAEPRFFLFNLLFIEDLI